MNTQTTVADLKSHLSEYLSRVVYRHETIVVTRHGKPIARLAPIEEKGSDLPYGNGLLEDGDSFFGIIDQIVADRSSHIPRVLDKPAS